MTNSIASAKCPPVLSSGNYGMSQNRYTDESKEYIFVKLTDSAYRAVEEYQRNQNAKRFTNGQSPKIQFIGNTGVIHFPTPDNNEDRKFGFSIDDVEGSLECIQQSHEDLDVLGSLSYRMRIHANDDVYDTTRTKMAIAEETEKSKCIREIKPNQTDIGRKVKKPVSMFHHQTSSGNNTSSSSFLSNSSTRNKLASLSNSSPLNGLSGSSSSKLGTSSSSRSPNPTMLGGSGTIGNSRNNNNSNNNNSRYNSHTSSSSNLYSQNASSLPSLTSASSLSSTLAGGFTNGYTAAVSPSESSNKSKLGGSGNINFLGGNSNGRGSNINASLNASAKGSLPNNKNSGSSGGSTSGAKLPDISRRKIRERLIHLLALKPFKKPELYVRLTNEGLKERERLLINNLLKDISTLSRDNTYNLRRQMWNDVNENWPYYTEQELQQLKRRKPQNLTPPLSSDAGSSTSGQSPTSTHTGSPPPLVGNGNSGMNGLKRTSLEFDRYEDSGVQSKKQRISHFKKDGISTVGNVSGNISSSRLNYGSNLNGYAQQNRTAANSPHGYQNTQGTDENSGNSDLSYNVLDNVEDIMPHVEQSSYYSGTVDTKIRKSSGNGSNLMRNTGNLKEKRNSGGNSSSSNTSNNFIPQDRTNSNSGNSVSKEITKTSASSSSPTSYGCNFVPESKSNSGNRNGNNSANNNYQRQSPNNPQHHKTNNSVIYSPKSLMQVSPREESNSTNRSNDGSNRYSQSARSSSGKSVRATTSLPFVPQQQQFHQQQSHHFNQQQQQQQQQQQHQQATNLIEPVQQKQHSSPTQQIAAAASSYSSAVTASSSETSRYDFSKYTPITTIEQRRRYKTEFESDYDEYLKLLSQIEAVGKRFRSLAERLENARQGGCPDYYNIKQQIVSEYERIRNEETLQRDKQRFDYLHEKLAHIKQLVMDYDKTLTSNAAAAAAAVAQQKHQAREQQTQQNILSATEGAVDTNILTTRNSRLSPMINVESSQSPPTSNHYLHNRHQQQQQQQQHSQHHHQQQQYHDAETIQQQHHQQHRPNQISMQSLSSSNTAQQKHYATENYENHNIAGNNSSNIKINTNNGNNSNSNNNNNNNNNNSDSDDSSDSNSNDDDDDDDEEDDDDDDDDDDEDSNSNSNDDDDTEHY